LNVARVLRQLGHMEVAATGFAGGYNGQFIVNRVKDAGIRPEFIEAPGESRICLNVIDGRDGSSTEFLEPGPDVDAAHLDRFRDKLKSLGAESDLVIFSGSLPGGVSNGLYAELIEIARKAGAGVFLDTSGESLVRGVEALPTFIKPNEEEILSLLTGKDKPDLQTGITALMKKGIDNVVVTLGAEGAVAGIGGKLYRVRIPRITPVNTVGSGDSFVAGFAYGYVRGWAAEQNLKCAAAAGSANALSPTTGDVSVSDHRKLMDEIIVEEWL